MTSRPTLASHLSLGRSKAQPCQPPLKRIYRLEDQRLVVAASVVCVGLSVFELSICDASCASFLEPSPSTSLHFSRRTNAIAKPKLCHRATDHQLQVGGKDTTVTMTYVNKKRKLRSFSHLEEEEAIMKDEEAMLEEAGEADGGAGDNASAARRHSPRRTWGKSDASARSAASASAETPAISNASKRRKGKKAASAASSSSSGATAAAKNFAPTLEEGDEDMDADDTPPTKIPPPSALGRGPVVSVWLRPLRQVTSRQDPPSQGLSSRSSTQHLCLAVGWMVSTEPAGGIDCSPLPILAYWAGGTASSPSALEPMLA